LSKKEQVAGMFDDIAPKYDFLNRFLSAGIDKSWRKKAILELKSKNPLMILDMATGTADVAIMTCALLKPDKIIGLDISEGMLDLGRKKILDKGLEQTIQLLKGDSEAIQFPDATFDAVTVAFGVRNFQNLEKGIAEIYRVLKPNGKLVVLEFSQPRNILVRAFYQLYMKVITPNFGKWFSKNNKAYKYLDESIRRFPEGEAFVQVLDKSGFQQTYFKSLSFGICSIYCGTK
jgi:demethylmenaquinone methyltransferase/2-methoxy-6-polyprenyl-1,4-benzoquinol methylase